MCAHFHIPVQSGDNEILSAMRRPYDAELIRSVVRSMRETNHRTCIGMDVMVGFPGEDDASHAKTRALIEELAPSYLHVFPYSPRPGTRAASLKPNVPDHAVRNRVEALRSLSHTLRESFYRGFLGVVLPGVPESSGPTADGSVTVRTDNYIPVHVHPEELSERASIAQVRLDRISNGAVLGSVVP
jgi:threonylcarbamoyladenosine tRNA methylthiotransferase MtaB